MARVKRMERVVALTKQLVDHPYQLFSFTYFCKKFEVEDLSKFKSSYEEDKEHARLREISEQTGMPFEDLLKGYEESKKAEEEKTSLTSKLSTLESENEQLKKELESLKGNAELDRMYSEDKEVLRAIDPTIDIEKLDPSFFDFRLKMGYDAKKAYYAMLGLTQAETPAPVIGKVKPEAGESDFISEEDWDLMSDSDKKRILKDKPSLAWSSMQKWMKK